MRLHIPSYFWQAVGYASLLLLQMNAVLGSVYPTQPTSKTKFFSGKPAVLIWKDDTKTPHIANMPRMKIELYNNSDYITTLAKHVHPASKSHTVSIPPGLETGYHYSLVFSIKDPPTTIWTADFTILSQSQNYLFPARPAIANSSTSASSTFNPAAAPTAVHPNPLGAHPGSPYRDGGNGSANGGATSLTLATMRRRVLVMLVPAFIAVIVL